ncbi:MAG TPA: hypothetical protein VFT95_23450, partial [Micromonosporaceae bacterium]|nr:hypothetical protein [Micromonosporaceae bacterium]
MNSYGDPSSARGRREADRDYYDSAPSGHSGSAASHASRPGTLARAAASVPVGRASAPVAAPGRASVGPAAGRATVGRASVRPISPAIGGDFGPGGPVGPGGPGGPGGPRGRGAGRRPMGPEARKRAKR